jgi:hypothetical protein
MYISPQKYTKLQLTWKKPASIKTGEKIQFWYLIFKLKNLVFKSFVFVIGQQLLWIFNIFGL